MHHTDLYEMCYCMIDELLDRCQKVELRANVVWQITNIASYIANEVKDVSPEVLYVTSIRFGDSLQDGFHRHSCTNCYEQNEDHVLFKINVPKEI